MPGRDFENSQGELELQEKDFLTSLLCQLQRNIYF